MTLPAFFPNVQYKARLSNEGAIPLIDLCKMAGVECLATGAWTKKPIVLTKGDAAEILSEPGDWGVVQITTPNSLSQRDQARWALGALAYVLFNGVARASIAGLPWTKIREPRGRKPSNCRALSSSERQNKYRRLRT